MLRGRTELSKPNGKELLGSRLIDLKRNLGCKACRIRVEVEGLGSRFGVWGSACRVWNLNG